jgi:hypothetical protein
MPPSPVVRVLTESKEKVPMEPKEPRAFPWRNPPAAWAVSSMTGRLWREATSMISRIRAWAPSIWTGMIARVRGVILRARSSGSMFREASISVKTGTAPASRMASQVATKVKPVVTTSSPKPIPKAARATFRAVLPEETARARSRPVKAAKAFSNSSTLYRPCRWAGKP